MDLSRRLPDDVFLKIFKYLAMEDCARLGCVNKSFHRMSQLVISRTKSLHFTNECFRNLKADQLAVILDLCSPNLERVWFPNEGGCFRQTGFQSPQLAAKLANTLANYECPQLTFINLGDTLINSAVFEQLIRNNSNLETLWWRARFVGFPDVIRNSLKRLRLCWVNDVTLRSMIGRIPNVEELDLIDSHVTANVLDEFFASSQRIQRVKLRLITNYIVFDESLVSFWNLPLTNFSIEQYGGKVDLQKVATSFPYLQTLDVTRSRNYGISSLAALHELKFLHLDSPYTSDDEIQALVDCKKLGYLSLESSITAGTLITLLRSCPELDCVCISEIDEVDTPDEAAVVLGSLSGIAMRFIEIRFNPIIEDEFEEWLRSIWESEAAKEAVKNLKQNEGIKVFIDL